MPRQNGRQISNDIFKYIFWIKMYEFGTAYDVP